MIFGAFFMILGSTALLSVVGNFTELMVKLNLYERESSESKEEVLSTLKRISEEDGHEDVSELEFYKFSLLRSGVSQESIEHITEAFQRLNPTNGAVTLEAVHKALKEAPISPRPE